MKKTWFLSNNNVNTLKVEATPNSELSIKVHRAVSERGILADVDTTKVSDIGGKLIYLGLAKTQNFGGQGSCFLGKKCNTDSETDCRIRRSVYQTECQNCLTDEPPLNSVDLGTIGCLTHKRQLEYMCQVTAKSSSNAQSKHHWNEQQSRA